MGENIRRVPPQHVEPCPFGQEGKAGLGEIEPPFAPQQGLQLRPQRVQVQHIGGGVGKLLGGQLDCAPVGGLLLLRQLDAQQVAAQVAQPVAIGEGARQLGRDFRALHRRHSDAERLLQHCDVEPREMHQLGDGGVGQQAGEVGAVEAAAAEGHRNELHQMHLPITGRELYQAQTVAARVQAHGLGIDGDGSA